MLAHMKRKRDGNDFHRCRHNFPPVPCGAWSRGTLEPDPVAPIRVSLLEFTLGIRIVQLPRSRAHSLSPALVRMHRRDCSHPRGGLLLVPLCWVAPDPACHLGEGEMLL